MLRALLLVIVLGGCNAAAEPPARFPHHRHDHDQKIEQLLTQVAQLDALSKRVTALEAALDFEQQLVKELQNRIGASARPPAAP